MKFMTRALLILVSALFTFQAQAQNAGGPTIFDVRRSLPLEPDEPVTKDFYINVGPESGLKKGVYVSVVRAVPVHDPIQNKQQATLNVPVGKLYVIDVQRGITVARLDSELTDDDRPTLEFEGVMVGDRIDLATITSDAPKKPKKQKRTTASETPATQPAEAKVEVKTESLTTLAPAAPTTLAPTAPATEAAAATPNRAAPAAVTPAAAPSASTDNPASNVIPAVAPVAPSVPKTSRPPTSADSREESVDTPDFA